MNILNGCRLSVIRRKRMTSSGAKDVKMALNGPVFFLIQEQAKSAVAIQALQSRMAVLENLQERLMKAIDDVHNHLTPSGHVKNHAITQLSPTIEVKSYANIASAFDKKLRFADLENTAYSRSTSASGKSDSSKSDSLNKDSGIGASENSFNNSETNKNADDDDELLKLLDLIDQKSVILLKQVEGSGEQEIAKRASEMSDSSSALLLDNLLFEKVDTQRQLSEVKAERDELRRRLAKLELATEAVTKEKIKVQQQLDLTLQENQSLQERIQKAGDYKLKSESLGYMEDIEKANMKRKYLQFSEKSRIRVSTILKETNVLELQKQLLTYVMENDVLRAKLEQDEPTRLANWLKVEAKLKHELKEALELNQNLQETIRSKNLEIASLKDKVRALEEALDSDSCVKNFGMGSNDDWREPGLVNVYNKRSNLNIVSPYSPLGYGDFSKTQSLPAMLLLDAQAKMKEQINEQQNFANVYDTGSFTDIPLNQSFQSENTADHSSHMSDNSKDLVDLSSPMDQHYSSTSTLMQSHYLHQPMLQPGLSAPNLSGRCNHSVFQNWGFVPRKMAASEIGERAVGAKLVNGHLCWKGANTLNAMNGHRDISSICTEFDPLSDESPSCENFVDSLNLSIPLKPTQVAISQLSSIGDSLHSASLDLGCASNNGNQDNRKINIARSVDGIRELFVDSTYCKRPPSLSSQFGHSSVAPSMRMGKSGRHVPVNLMNCMHESSDYSLL